MVGIHILKHRFDFSDEKLVQGLHENVYWMGFCGMKLQLRWEHEGEADLLVQEAKEANSKDRTGHRSPQGGSQ